MKSNFFKLCSMFLCGAMLAFAGCADFSQDIQELDKKADGFKTELDDYKASTATTIAELQATIDALEATQEKIAAEYAKKDDLQAAKEELQGKLTDLNSKIEAAVTEATAAIANLDAAKADKTAVAEIQEKVNAAIAEANTAIANLDAAKADKTQVNEIESDVATLIEGYQQMIAQFQNLSLIVDGKAAQADLELVENDVESLKQGYMETVAALQQISATLDTKANQADLELAEKDIEALKTASAEAVLAITNLQAQADALDARVEALESGLKTVQEEIALHTQTLQNLAGRLEAVEGNLEDEAAAREAADAELQEAISLLNMGLTNLQMKYDIYLEELDAQVDALDARVEALEVQDALIYKTIEDKCNTLEINIKETAAAIRAEQATAIAALEKKIQENWEAERALIYNTINDIQSTLMEAIENNGEDIEDLQAQLEQHVADIYKTILSEKATLETMIEEGDDASQKALEDAIADVYKSILSYNDTYEIRFEAIEDELLRIVEEDLTLVYKTIQNTKLELQAEIDDLRKEFETLVSTVSMDVEALLDRVQSLVYVPEYNDHKGTINFALVSAGASVGLEVAPVIVPVNTVLKYRVHTADYDATKAAAELAAAWKSKLANLYYEVEDVKIRTRAAAEPTLVINDVKANGEYLEFTVLAENFVDDFYSEEASYSVSLVLTDGNNNRSTEYTNLVPNCVDKFNMVLYAGEGEDIAVYYANEIVGPADVPAAFNVKDYYIAANDPETVKTLVRPNLGFISAENTTEPATIFSAEDLAKVGLNMGDVKFETLWGTINVANNSDGATFVDGKSQIAFVKGTPDWTVKVTDKCTWDMVGKSAVLTYKYTWAGQTISLGHKVEVSNAQVEVNMEADDTWTIAKMNSLFEVTHYAKDHLIKAVPFTSVGGQVAHLTPVLNSPAVLKEGYPKFYTMDATGEWKETERSFKLAKFNDNRTVDIEMLGGEYSWNNSYKIVWATTNNNDHVDYTTTAIVNLVGRPEKIDVEIPVEFVLKGNNSWFEAPADLCGEAFKKLDQYIEFGDTAADKAWWESVFKSFVTRYNNQELGLPLVNDNKDASKWIANLDQLATAKLFIGRNLINEDTPNVITWSVTPWWGVPVNFTVTGNITIPEYEFIYSEDYVENATAKVYGQIENDEYNIDRADLAKYFNLKAESLDGHNYTVDFEVVAPVATAAESVKVEPSTTANVVADKGTATYYYLTQDQAVLDWNTYKGLEVKVNATLKVNGFERETLPLTLVTEDPLKLTGADISADRQLRENLEIKVFEKLVLTSSVENYANLLTTNKKALSATNIAEDLAAAEKYAADVYGADIDVRLGAQGVYYYNNSGELIILGANKYSYSEETGILTIYGDDAQVKNYYADFTAIMTSRICGGEHQVPFRVTVSLKK